MSTLLRLRDAVDSNLGLNIDQLSFGQMCLKFGGKVFAITGNKDSSLAKEADLKIILPEEVKPSTPRQFYTRAAYVLSRLPVKLAERLGERALNLSEYIISWYHSVTQ